MTQRDQAIKQWLNILDAGARLAGGKPFASGYSSPAGLVLDRGCAMRVSRSKPPHCGPMKQCYANAQRTIMDYPGEYRYAEGWAILGDPPIPVMHAWCLTQRGLVVDPTWCGRGRAHYYGIEIEASYVLREVLRTEVYHSVIDDWEHGFRLLSDPKLVEKYTRRCGQRRPRQSQ